MFCFLNAKSWQLYNPNSTSNEFAHICDRWWVGERKREKNGFKVITKETENFNIHFISLILIVIQFTIEKKSKKKKSITENKTKWNDNIFFFKLPFQTIRFCATLCIIFSTTHIYREREQCIRHHKRYPSPLVQVKEY